ncbi:multidrug ABC transporter ATP-binding protein [Sulfolobus sp. A20]|uniref:ABC transporter permease n=1 Tax=Sulfolobaceae TaxID=118883 RepID=UPI0008460A52|nr:MULTISPECIES: ABC transporter permease [unclassified Sulfolobus]TRM76091.1 ABC transporter permease [Sulfolobus sp. A20-N-F8]TRM76304.1 ABC transporter permease [Sulfolobus sp. E5]TRM77137.1 ABC transporter permease [Sulfolobus sp. B5]TRM80969.1 ABC transporter permease [Sulfolobus sp. D5]TRM84021.1 ABC transporter permease [Sulfolobus sp. A20-N-F6]TRM88566.1 ABC transporter permease [Sulfolobus sp. C3]TRM94800.1 ABC transporter permease [Sulfolobus sp. A20-N-G8]TRN02673.1 ABC transporte
MLSEFFNLIVMQFKMVKAYLPAFLFFSILFPIGFMLVFGNISIKSLTPYIVAGTITFYISVGVLTSVAQSLAFERNAGRFSLMIATGIPRELYAISIALSNGLGTLIMVPIILILGEFLLHVRILSIPYLIVSLLASIFMGSMLGMTLGLGIRNLYAVNQYSTIIGFVLSFFAPVYFPLYFIPLPFRYLTFLEPTTYVSQALYNALIGNPSSLLWCLGIIVYAIIFVLLNRFVLRRQ